MPLLVNRHIPSAFGTCIISVSWNYILLGKPHLQHSISVAYTGNACDIRYTPLTATWLPNGTHRKDLRIPAIYTIYIYGSRKECIKSPTLVNNKHDVLAKCASAIYNLTLSLHTICTVAPSKCISRFWRSQSSRATESDLRQWPIRQSRRRWSQLNTGYANATTEH